jgi:hypothetical protein
MGQFLSSLRVIKLVARDCNKNLSHNGHPRCYGVSRSRATAFPRATAVSRARLTLSNVRPSGQIAHEIDPALGRHEVDDGLVLRPERFDVSSALLVRFSERVLCALGREQDARFGKRDSSPQVPWQCRQGAGKRCLGLFGRASWLSERQAQIAFSQEDSCNPSIAFAFPVIRRSFQPVPVASTAATPLQ